MLRGISHYDARDAHAMVKRDLHLFRSIAAYIALKCSAVSARFFFFLNIRHTMIFDAATKIMPMLLFEGLLIDDDSFMMAATSKI